MVIEHVSVPIKPRLAAGGLRSSRRSPAPRPEEARRSYQRCEDIDAQNRVIFVEE
jgi:hypothetical protein